jgi:hypothetical protein
MNKKTLVQYVLYLLVFIILFAFFNTYFSKEKIEPKIETKKGTTGDQIEDIQYISSDADGNTYLIKAETGVTSLENKDIINLTNVRAKIILVNNDKILIFSDFANYNTDNFDTDFSKNVKAFYNMHDLTCENIKVKFSENYAKIYENVVYDNKIAKLYADKIEIDLIKRTSKISMFENKKKVKITYKNNGTN